MQDVNQFSQALLEKVNELADRISKTGDKNQIAEVENYRQSIQNNIVLAEFANSDGMKILIEYVLLEQNLAIRQITDKNKFFENKDSYFKEVERSWNKIDQVQWFLDVLLGRDKHLEIWNQELDRILNKKSDGR